MNSSILLEVFIIFLLVLANGLFAMSETAVVSARKPRLQQWADEGNQRARRALQLVEEPADFLSTVQIGITLIGIVAGVFGGATLADELAALLEAFGLAARHSTAVSVALVVFAITYLSLVIGELVPKSIALNHAESIAVAVAPIMYRLSRLAYPIVYVLTLSTNSITRLLRIGPSKEPPVTDEEIALMMQQGAQVGVFEPVEPEMVKRIFRLSDRKVNSLMTPRREIIWLDKSDPPDLLRQKITGRGFTQFPMADGDLDHILGLVKAKDLLKQILFGEEIDLDDVVHPPLFVPESMEALELLNRFKQEHVHMALVLDEYGGLEGLVTSTDLLEAIVGDIDLPVEPGVIQREDGTWLVDGLLPVVELMDLLDLDDLPNVGKGYYQTVGGLMMANLERVPVEGDYFDWGGFRFEVLDMDGLRVDKVLAAAKPGLTSDEGIDSREGEK